MNPAQLNVEAGGTTYTFRLPSSKDMIQVDIDALKLRGGQTEGLGIAFTYSHSIALLNRLCVSPEKVDFGDMDAPTTEFLGSKLATWLNSFSERVGAEKGAVDSGDNSRP